MRETAALICCRKIRLDHDRARAKERQELRDGTGTRKDLTDMREVHAVVEGPTLALRGLFRV
jgi:hypothetical protein